MRQDRSASHQLGLSLIEVLVGLTIIAMMGAVVVVMLDTRRTAVDATSERLVRALAEAREEALQSGQVIGFGADEDARGWQFYRFIGGRWQIMRDHPALEPVRLDPDLALMAREGVIARRSEEGLRVGPQTPELAPQVWFDPAGFDTPFVYEVRADADFLLVERLDDGELRLTRQNDAAADGGRS